MSALHYMEPVLRHDFLGADPLAHFVHKDFRPAAGQAVKPSLLQTLQSVENGHPCLLGKILDFRSRKGMNRNLRIFFLDAAQHRLIVFQSQIGIKAALYHNLRAACSYRFAHLLQDFLIGQQICVLGLLAAEKGTEFALIFTYIRVVYIPIHNKGHGIIKELPPHFIGADAQFNGVAACQQFYPLRFTKPHQFCTSR